MTNNPRKPKPDDLGPCIYCGRPLRPFFAVAQTPGGQYYHIPCKEKAEKE